MGIINDAKQSTAANLARRAAQAGQSAFLYRYLFPASVRMSAPVHGAAEVIEGIESAGWQLQQIAYDTRSRKGSCLMLFRRAPQGRH